MAGFIRPKQLQELQETGHVIVENFCLVDGILEDIHNLKGDFRTADTGGDGRTLASYDAVRKSQTLCLSNNNTLPPSEARQKLLEVLDNLKEDLNTLHPLDELTEIMYVYYPEDGYYKKHVDAEKDSVSCIRKYSFCLYLQTDWQVAHGGCLRLYDTSELINVVDVPPRAGTLVLFASDQVPHEVLTTHKERYAIVGWFLASDSTNATSSTTASVQTKKTVDPANLDALRRLRDAVPGIAPTTKVMDQTSQNGLLGEFDFDNAPKKVEERLDGDADPSYWKTVCAFSKTTINTLSLAGKRLHRVNKNALLQPAFFHVTTLMLGNTDIPVPILKELLQNCTHLKSLHLSGNALGDEGTQEICSVLPKTLQTLDLRYNDITAVGVGAIPLTQLSVLYLEGNLLGDDGAAAVAATGKLRELYLGQNGIGSAGAEAIAAQLKSFQLQKLYLEGNNIGMLGAQHFIDALNDLGQEKSLKKLYVDNNNIGKETAQKVGKALGSVTMIGDGGLFQE